MSGGPGKPAVTVVADVPSPYQNVFFEAVRKLGEVDLEVLYCRRAAPGRGAWRTLPPAAVPHRFLAPFGPRRAPTNPALVPRLLRHPERLPFVIGYYLPSMVSAATALTATRRRWVFWIDSLPPPSDESCGVRAPLRAVVRALALRNATLCLATGSAGATSLVSRGVPPDRVMSLPFVVDTAWIEREVAGARRDRDRVRADLRLSTDDRVLLYVGQLIPRKGLDLLLHALARAQRSRDRATRRLAVVVLGDGPSRDDLCELTAKLGLDDLVRWIPGVPNDELPPYWAAADAFVLPSRFDAWGTVVSEACSAGLPVVGSDACGAVRDLIDPTWSGWMFQTGSVEDLAACLMDLRAREPSELAAMGHRAQESVSRCRPNLVAQRFTEVVDKVLKFPPRTAS